MGDAICDLVLGLTREGVLPLAAPQHGDTPETYLLRSYLDAHANTLGVADVDIQLQIEQRYRSGGTLTGLGLTVTPQRGQVVDLRKLRFALHRRDPHLFGALMTALRDALAPYAPVFTALDALVGEERMLYGDDWLISTEEAFFEDHEQEVDGVDIRDLARWADRRGFGTPFQLGKKYPRPLWTAPDPVLDTLHDRLVRHQELPGLREARELLRFIATLPSHWPCEREWYRVHSHPGLIHVVICQAEAEKDPVLEFYRDLHDLLGMPGEVEVEPLRVPAVHDAASHEDALAYLQAVRTVQAMAGVMWAALEG